MSAPRVPTSIETGRLVLRPQDAEDAGVYHQLWTERDPRVPPHRRIATDGRPTVEDIATQIRAERDSPKCGLLTIVRKHENNVIGYCGLLFGGRGSSQEPELAYELLRRAHGAGYATEAARAVVAWAAENGCQRLWAGVREWNLASRRVLDKLAFVDTGGVEPDADHGNTLVTARTFPKTVLQDDRNR